MKKYIAVLLGNLLIATTLLTWTPITAFAQGDPFGFIDEPPGVAVISDRSGLGGDDIPILYFISMLIRLAVIVAGVWGLLNFLLAGWGYIGSGGNAQAHSTARDRMSMTVLGLILMISIYTMAGVIGLVFFGDASFILNPKISGPIPL